MIAFILLSLVAIVNAQCPTCNTDLAALTAAVQVCGNDGLHTFNANDFNLISIGSATLPGNVRSLSGGDVEGRVLAAGDLFLGPANKGYSIGDKIVNYPGNAAFSQKAYSAVVGGSIYWPNGQLNPVNNDATHRVENGVYYGASTAPSWLRFSLCQSGSLDLTALRTALQNLSTAYSTAVANAWYETANNGQTIVLHGAGDVCNMLVRINASDWNAHHSFMLTDNWNVGATVVVDIVCDGNPFLFMQGEFPGLASNIVYNFGPSCDGVEIQAQSVTGSILAPWSTLDQSSGRILGNVYVGNVAAFLQINVVDCPPNPNVCDCCNLCVMEKSPIQKCTNLGNKHF